MEKTLVLRHSVTTAPFGALFGDIMNSDAEYAARYRWLKSRKGLSLLSEPPQARWFRYDGTEFRASHYLAEGGTQHAPYPTLDETIDAAMLVSKERELRQCPAPAIPT